MDFKIQKSINRKNEADINWAFNTNKDTAVFDPQRNLTIRVVGKSIDLHLLPEHAHNAYRKGAW